MINKRLLGLIPEVKARTLRAVFFQWLCLVCSITVTVCFCVFLNDIMNNTQHGAALLLTIAAAAAMRVFFTRIYSDINSETARMVKRVLRERVFERLCAVGVSYTKSVSTAEAVQVSVEGAEQLETYFSQYMPQLFYSLLSTLTFFALLCFICPRSALVLLICVPVIPMSIVFVQKIAKRILSKYWNSYTSLGDGFLENIQGLTTLKIYQSDGVKHAEMNKNAELFRRATMRVLTMQLNSISIMDMVAYGGAAASVCTALTALAAGRLTFFAAMITVFLSAEFFIPLRQLGSFFHVAMNGAAAADKIFRILDMHVSEKTGGAIPAGYDISIKDLSFSYDGESDTLSGISMELAPRGHYAVVGVSGCGKSTLAAVLSGINTDYSGSVRIGGAELSSIDERGLLDTVTLVTHSSHIFEGSVRYNLALGAPDASDKQMTAALKRVRLWDFLSAENGLDTAVSENGANLSGGQRQRLAIARALLHDTPIYIFDEASSNIDVESEAAINEVIRGLAKDKLIIVISHRMANAAAADKIFVMKDGRLCETGTHDELMSLSGHYAEMTHSQTELERYTGGDANE